MSLETNLRNFITRVGTEFKAIRAITGDPANLTTTQKSNLVAALNELKAALANASGINDTTPGTTTTYSSTKIDAQISAAIAALVNGAPTALDTLKELTDKLSSEDSVIAAITTALDNRVRFDAAQTLTGPQQAQARTNIGAVAATDIGNFDRDLVADFNAALV
ncbi:hypothetical protein [Deinococcus apachensis]|uniref:hypothetical protein n=1 Tax=Deinococcus apachensis TaxID=309886 RepID=UPI000374480B|nr:hypothetical protein [Deinococcus apachensis]